MGQAPMLKNAGWLRDPQTMRVIAALQTGPATVRFVGGCVRNSLLGDSVTDIDLATVHEPGESTRLLSEAGIKVVPTGIEHGTVTAVVDGKSFEVTTLRADIETFGRHAVVRFGQSWSEDAARRDFTMNAIYADPDGTLFDPVGGVADAQARRVRFIGQSDRRIKEDFLRILRFFRFNAQYSNGEVDAEALSACARNASGLSQLSGERIQGELFKLLAAPAPGKWLAHMNEAGVLARVLPHATLESIVSGRIDDLPPQLRRTGTRELALIRLCALLESREKSIDAVADALKLSNEAKTHLLAISAAQNAVSGKMNDADMRRATYRHSGALRDAIAVAYFCGQVSRQEADRLLSFSWIPPRFPITGADVVALGLAPGPDIGAVLKEVERWWIDQDFRPDERQLAEYLGERVRLRK